MSDILSSFPQIPADFLIGLSILVIATLLWNKWMTLTKKLLSDRIYHFFLRYLHYSEIRALFSSLFYGLYGTFVSIILIFWLHLSIIDQITLHNLFTLIIDSLAIFFATIALIFVSLNFLMLFFPNTYITSEDFKDSWMEIYLNIPSRLILIITAMVPVFTEELMYRLLIITFLKKYVNENNVPLPKILTNSLIIISATLLFVLQQATFLKQKKQFLTIGTGAAVIGFINSTALLFGASFWSLLIAHYLYFALILIQSRKVLKQISHRLK